ncbi:MAG: hypothetical protein MHM6MM_004699, partial [Cercozoa sp. M6MM]
MSPLRNTNSLRELIDRALQGKAEQARCVAAETQCIDMPARNERRLPKPLLPLRLVMAWAKQTLHALDRMHTGGDSSTPGIAHCDVKPSNLVIGQHFCVQLCDFGSATPLALLNDARNNDVFDLDDDNESVNLLLRELAHGALKRHRKSAAAQENTPKERVSLPTTAEYAAPEVVHPTRGVRDGRVDIWSFGVSVFEALNGCSPFWDAPNCAKNARQLKESPLLASARMNRSPAAL